MNLYILYLKRKFWAWPDGFVWKIAEKLTLKSRRKKYDLFISVIRPKPQDKILDVGVAPYASYSFRSTNYLEKWFPHHENITALTNDDPERFKDFHKHFPMVKLVFGDGRNLEFPSNYFDIVFSNAVVEHVGKEEEQRKFIYELCRVGKRIFITTPNRWFPVDPHTLIPFAHWLPQKIKFWIYKKLGREYWAHLNHLNPLTPKNFLSLFPSEKQVRLFKQSVLGIPCNLIAIVEK